MIEAYAKSKGKSVHYVRSFPPTAIARRIHEGTRWDQPFVDFLREKQLPFVDVMEAHLADFDQYRIDVKDYLAQYFIGHYNPRGKHFCAFSLKDQLVEMLEPKPVLYWNDRSVAP